MAVSQRRRRTLTWVALASSVAIVSAGCASNFVEISTTQLQGHWTNASGASLDFNADRTFTSTRLERSGLDPFFCADLDDATAGSWAFWVPSGSPGGFVPEDIDNPADRGDGVTVLFEGIHCALSLNTYGDPEEPTMCLVGDPDSTCSSSEEFHRRDQPAVSRSR
ncbi:hypothetical protein [Streptomyces sp. NBC_00306]|uniref:hypothetical protein n=1 Tax=Streptomyces sp. NBC_00306 TaxID=2975708 RepID=UPI002E2E3B23|nr:hypothetical protein [Streptomyces sp. NBC_00306]